MSRWLDRPWSILLLAFIGGAVTAAIVVLVVIFTRGGDGDEDADAQQLAAAATAEALVDVAEQTPGPTAPQVPDTTGPSATATPSGLTDPDEALAAFIQAEMESEHIGPCPQELAEGEPAPSGVCSEELYRTEALVTFFLGPPFAEFMGEAVLTRNEDGSWSVNFIPSPPLGESSVAVGTNVVVFGVGDCLRFRADPGLSGEQLACRADGTTGQVVEGPQTADDHTWWRLDGLGWASDKYLVPAQ